MMKRFKRLKKGMLSLLAVWMFIVYLQPINLAFASDMPATSFGQVLDMSNIELAPGAKLTVKPNMERVLTEASILFEADAVDENGQLAATPEDLIWTVDPSLGSIDANGVFTAGESAAIGSVNASADSLYGASEIEVVDQLTELQFPDIIKTFDSGATAALQVIALRNGQVIQANNTNFEWWVEGAIGTISEDGVFTATTANNQSGKIFVKYGGIETSMDVNVGITLIILEDFENGINNYMPSSAAANSVNISLETDEDFVRFGNTSLKLEYDFVGQIGTSGAYLSAKDIESRIQIPGYPEKIGMWVYGDGKNHWLRGQLRDGNNAAFAVDFTDSTTGVNWTGWKYVEVSIPQGKATPLTMDLPVRYMETSNAKKTSGVIYIDQIRAIYGPVDEDRTPPILKNPYPAEDEIVFTATPDIRVIGEDDGYDLNIHSDTTLIDPDFIRVYLDGTLVNHDFYQPEGRITYKPETPLVDGVHTIRVSIRDLSGNQTIKEWNFMVNTGAPKFVYTTPSEIYADGTYTLDIRGEKVNELQGGFIEFGFDPDIVQNLKVLKGEKITDNELQAVVNEETGNVTVTFHDLDQLALNDSDLIAQIQYTVQRDILGPLTIDEASNEVTHSNLITYVSGSIVKTGGAGIPLPYNGPQISSTIKTDLQLIWNDSVIGLGYPASFSVYYKNGNPAVGAKLLIDGVEVQDTITNGQGLLTTEEATKAAGTYKIQAVADGKYSPTMTLKVQNLAGTPVPHNISITMGANPTESRNFSWHTHPDIKSSVVEIVKQSELIEDFNQSNILTFNGESFIYNTSNAGTLRVHQVSVEGLEPDTVYSYRVGDGNGNYSTENTFKTSPESGDVTKFIFIGDSQAADKPGYELWGNTLQKALEFIPDADFVAHAGDMVDKGYEEKEWNWWFEAAQENLLKTTIVPIIGNHEVMGLYGNSDYLAHFNNPKNGLKGLEGSSFSFDVKDAHFVVLNSEMKYEEQKDWLRADLKKTDKKWKVVFFHRGPYGSIYDTPEVRKNWTPIFDEYGVDLVMNGHEHVYLRTFPMKGDKQVAEGEGTVYVVGGASASKFYPLTEKPFQEVTFDETKQIYTAVEINGDQMTVIARTVDGQEIDRFQLAAKPKATKPADKSDQGNMDINPNPENVPGRFVIKAEDLNRNDGKSIVVEHSELINEWILPGNVTTWTGDQPITIKAPNMHITIPSEVLKALSSLVQAGEQSDSMISLKAFQVEEAQAERLLAHMGEQSGAHVSGDIFDYTLSIAPKDGQAIQLNQFSEPITIAFKVHPNANKKLTGIYYISDSGKLEYMGGRWQDDMLTATVSHFSKYAALEYDKNYTDVPQAHWASEVIRELSAKQLVNGINATSFAPDRNVTRAEFAAMLVRALNVEGEATQSFTDVSKDKWYANEIALAAKAGIVNGISSTKFAPEDSIKRQEMAAMIVRAYEYALGNKLASSGATKFTDMASAPQWAKTAIQSAFEAGLLNGRSNSRFEPLATGTRAEVAKLIHNLITVIE